MEEEVMTQRMMMRSLLVATLTLSLAAPAVAAAPAQPADSPSLGWRVRLGDLVSRAVTLVFGETVGESEPGDRQGDLDGGVRSIAGKDGTDGGSNTDPNG